MHSSILAVLRGLLAIPVFIRVSPSSGFRKSTGLFDFLHLLGWAVFDFALCFSELQNVEIEKSFR